jgi:hypothetical protein
MGLHAARLVMLGCGALLGAELALFVDDLTEREGNTAGRARRKRLGWLAWAVTVSSAPLVFMSGAVYPDIVGALLIVVALRRLVRFRGLADAVVAAAAAALLPWFHIRFSIWAAGLLLGLCWRWRATCSLPKLASATASRQFRWDRRRFAMVMALPAVSGVGVILTTWSWYGSPLPTVVLHPRSGVWYENAPKYPYDVASLYRNVFGVVFGRAQGLLPWAPVFLVAIAGLTLAARRWGGWVWGLGGIVVVYLLAVGIVSARTNIPGRFLVIVVPLGAPVLLAAMMHRRWVIPIVGVLALSGGVLSLQAIRHFSELYPRPDGLVAVPIAAGLQAPWPNLSIGPDAADNDLTIPLDQLRGGRVVIDRTLGRPPLAGGPVDQVVESSGVVGGEVAVFGPLLLRGRYDLDVTVRCVAPCAAGSISVDGGGPATALDPTGMWATLPVSVLVASGHLIQPVIRQSGPGIVRVAQVHIHHLPPPTRSSLRFPNPTWVLAWLVAIAAAGAIMANRHSSARSEDPDQRPTR